jgi:MFS family permease
LNRDISRLIVLKAAGSAFFLYPVYTLFLLSRDLDLTGIMTLESILALALILWEVPSGALADRFGKKRLIAFGCLLELISSVPMLWVEGFWAFGVLYALSGVGIASLSGSLEAYLYEKLENREEMTRYLGYLRGAEWSGMMFGALVGGVIIAQGAIDGYSLCIQLFIAAQVVALVAALTLTVDAPGKGEHRDGFSTILRSGGRMVFGVGGVLVLVLMAMAIQGLSDRHYLWQPYFQGQGLEVRWFGLMAVLVCGCCTAGSLAAGWVSRKLTRRTVIVAAGVLMLASLGVISGIRDYRIAIFAFLLLFFLGNLIEPIFTSMLNERFPDEARATALSCASWVSGGIVMAVRPGMGFLADMDITYPFVVDIAVVGTGVLAVLVGWRWIGRTEECEPDGAQRM